MKTHFVRVIILIFTLAVAVLLLLNTLLSSKLQNSSSIKLVPNFGQAMGNFVYPLHQNDDLISDKNISFFTHTDNQYTDINFSPYLEIINRDTDMHLSAHALIDSKNRYWYGFKLKSSGEVGLMKRIGWIDRRLDIHDTPCVRVFIFVNKELSRKKDVTHLFELEILLGNKSVILKNATIPPGEFGRNGRGFDGTSVTQAQMSFSLKKLLADQNDKKISPRGIIRLKNQSMNNSSFDIELREIKKMEETADGYFMCMHPLYGIFPSKDENFFIEWVEFHLMMGVKEIHMPNSTWKVSENMQNILNMYRQLGKVFVHPNYSPFYAREEKYKSKLQFGIAGLQNRIGIQTCFFSNLHRFKYMIVLDLDEFIVPTKGNNYNDMFLYANMSKNSKYPIALGCVWEMYYLYYKPITENNESSNLRSRNKSSLVSMNYRGHVPPHYGHVKSFLSTSKCAYANSHQCTFPLGVGQKKSPLCSTHHYRKKCIGGRACSAKPKINSEILRFRDGLMHRYQMAQDTLQEYLQKLK